MNAAAVALLLAVVAAGFVLRRVVLANGGRMGALTQAAVTVTAAVAVAHIWNNDPSYPANLVGTLLIGGFAVALFHAWDR